MTWSDASFFPFPSAEEKTAKTTVQQAPDDSQQTPDGTQLPSGHLSPATSQGSGSKCPFLAAQLSQTGSSVFRKASLELQEDVQEMHAVRKGTRNNSGQWEGSLSFCSRDPRFMCELLLGQQEQWQHLPLLVAMGKEAPQARQSVRTVLQNVGLAFW